MNKFCYIFTILLWTFAITNSYGQGGVRVETPSEYIDVSSLKKWCGIENYQLIITKYNPDYLFTGKDIILRKYEAKFKADLRKLCEKPSKNSADKKDVRENTRNDENHGKNTQVKGKQEQNPILETNRYSDAATEAQGNIRVQGEQGEYLNQTFTTEQILANQGKKGYNYEKTTEQDMDISGKPQNTNFLNLPDPDDLIDVNKEDIIVIGKYRNQDILKKGDTIITTVNGNKYLLSRQTIVKQGDAEYGFLYPHGDFYLVHKSTDKDKTTTLTDLQTRQTAFSSNDAIGYITKGNYKFHEITCDAPTYNKFLAFCDWQICKMTNTTNVNKWNYAEYDQMIKEDIALNERILSAKLSEILVQLVGDFTSDKLAESFAGFDLNTSLQDWAMKTIWDEATQLQKAIGISGDCFSSMVGVISSLKKEKNPILETTVGDFIKSNNKEQDLYTTETYRTFKRIWVSALDAVGDCDKSGTIKKNILYHLLKNAPSGGEAIGLFAANVTIKISIAPEFKQDIVKKIEKAKKKKDILEKCRQEYEQKIRKIKGNCLEYTKTMNALKSGLFEQQYGSNELEEISKLMKIYVFGEEKIPVCNILNVSELKSDVK